MNEELKVKAAAKLIREYCKTQECTSDERCSCVFGEDLGWGVVCKVRNPDLWEEEKE